MLECSQPPIYLPELPIHGSRIIGLLNVRDAEGFQQSYVIGPETNAAKLSKVVTSSRRQLYSASTRLYLDDVVHRGNVLNLPDVRKRTRLNAGRDVSICGEHVAAMPKRFAYCKTGYVSRLFCVAALL